MDWRNLPRSGGGVQTGGGGGLSAPRTPELSAKPTSSSRIPSVSGGFWFRGFSRRGATSSLKFCTTSLGKMSEFRKATRAPARINSSASSVTAATSV